MWTLPHRNEMLDHIEQPDQYILLLYPRDHLKTSSVTSYLIKRLLFNPGLRVLCVSNTKELAIQNVGAIKAPMENNPKILRDFGEVRGEPWGTEKFTLKRPPSPGKEPSCIARSVGASALGMHFDLIWCDDIVSTETQWTQEQRDKTWAWFTGTLLRCLDRAGKLIVTGTRKHIDDLYHQLLTSEGWTSYVYKAIIQEEGREVLAPWLYDYDRLIARQDSAWVFIDYKGEEYDLTEYEISEGYPYQEDYTETSNSKLPRHRNGDYHTSWFKKLEANLDYLTKKANEAFGF